MTDDQLIDIEVPVVLLFRAPPDLDRDDLDQFVDAVMEHGTVRDVFANAIDGADREPLAYDGFAIPAVTRPTPRRQRAEHRGLLQRIHVDPSDGEVRLMADIILKDAGTLHVPVLADLVEDAHRANGTWVDGPAPGFVAGSPPRLRVTMVIEPEGDIRSAAPAVMEGGPV